MSQAEFRSRDLLLDLDDATWGAQLRQSTAGRWGGGDSHSAGCATEATAESSDCRAICSGGRAPATAAKGLLLVGLQVDVFLSSSVSEGSFLVAEIFCLKTLNIHLSSD